MPCPIFRLPGRALRPSALALNLAMAGSLLAAMGAAPAAQAQTVNTPARRYDIPAGPLNMTLNRYAQEAGVPLSAPGALTQGKTGPGPVSYTHLDVYKRQRCGRTSGAAGPTTTTTRPT